MTDNDYEPDYDIDADTDIDTEPDSAKPWHGVLVATALPFLDDPNLTVDFDRYAEHCEWLISEGCDAIVPNGSLGEYQTLSEEERAQVVRTAVEAVGAERVIPGVSAYSWFEAQGWAQQAAEEGCPAVLLLPPNTYRADERAVRDHFEAVAQVEVPIIAYNNPIDTKVDLTPELLAQIHDDGHIVAVKEFSGDVRRAYQIAELAPELDLLIGADDVMLELAIAGAKGWVAGYPNAFPGASALMYRAAVAGNIETARGLYRLLHPLLRWDSRTEFVQAIKLSMDMVGRYGGICRPPRGALTGEKLKAVQQATELAIDYGL